MVDLDGDTRLDFAVANGMGNVSVYLGNGDGTFKAGPATPAAGTGIAVGDFNGDRIPDLALSSISSPQATVMLGKGDGGFEAGQPYAVAGMQEAIAAGDVNGDGHSEIVTANVLNPGAITTELVSCLSTNPAGLPGVFTGTGDSSLSVLLAKPAGGFEPQLAYLAGSSPDGVVIADFDQDGRADIASTAFRSNDLTILAGHGDGSFEPAGKYAVATGAQTIIVRDYDGDGLPDIAAPGGNAPDVSVLHNISGRLAVAPAAASP
ncbi:MAG: FG-GAP repeat domain-containing protein [Dongiaceae bacterium]